MGGKGSGGRRVGAGRRRQSDAAGDLTGSRRTRARAKSAAPANQTVNQTANQTEASLEGPTPSSGVPIPEPPGNLTLDELAEWNDLAPRAATVGTLTDETKLALRDLCQARVLKDKLLRTVNDQGEVVVASTGNLAAHPLLARFTTLFQRVEAGMMRFKLSPMGKEIETSKEAPADPFAEFDAPPASTGDDETIN